MSAYFIAIDVGNSRVKCGLFETTDIGGKNLPTCLQSVTIAVGEELPWPTIRAWVGPNDSVNGIVAGANPRGVQSVVDTWPREKAWPLPTVIDKPNDFPIAIKVAAPEKVGIDRLLNAVAANRLCRGSLPAIIVSSGTATTVDYVDASGAFAGGAILPGFELSARALHQYTALLPLITMDELATRDHEALGKDTRHALRSGLFWGQLGAVRELVGQFQKLDSAAKQIILTGGGAGLLAAHIPGGLYEPHLALQGLAIVAGKRIDGTS